MRKLTVGFAVNVVLDMLQALANSDRDSELFPDFPSDGIFETLTKLDLTAR